MSSIDMPNSSSIDQLQEARSALTEGRIGDAIHILDKLVHVGDAEAMFLRSAVGLGDETTEHYEARSLALLWEAAHKQHAGAAYQLSIRLEEGDGIVAKDEQQARALLVQAAQAGHPHALWRLGLIRLYGDSSTVPDPATGKRLIEEAAAKRSQGALRTLAKFYEDGSFSYPQDFEIAKKLHDAADSDDVLPL